MSQLQVIALSCERGGRPLFAPQSFTLSAGQAMQIEGDNGSGKTSLLRMVCGLAPTASGEVRWGGQAIAEVRHAFSRDLLYLGHSLGLKDELSALENLQTASVLAGHPVSHPQALQARVLATTWWHILKNPTFVAFTCVSVGTYGGLFTFLASSSFVFIDLLGCQK